MFSRIFAGLYLLFIMVTSPILFVGAFTIWLFSLPFSRRKVLLHYYTCFWASLYLWLMPFYRVSVSGKEHFDRKKTFVIVSNHQSLLDVLVVFSTFIPFKWISKAEIFKIPFIGWNMYLNQYIRLVRGDKESIEKMYQEAKKHLTQGSSVYFFPEGTRSHDGQMKPFKLGAFKLAKELKLPILPILIDGTQNALPKKSLNFHGVHRISIQAMPQISYEETADLNIEQLAAHVHTVMQDELTKSRSKV